MSTGPGSAHDGLGDQSVLDALDWPTGYLDDLSLPVTPPRLAAAASRAALAAISDPDRLGRHWSRFDARGRGDWIYTGTLVVELALHDDADHEAGPSAHHVYVQGRVDALFPQSQRPQLLALCGQWNATRRWPTAAVLRNRPGSALVSLAATAHLPVATGMPTAALAHWLELMAYGVRTMYSTLLPAAEDRSDEFGEPC